MGNGIAQLGTFDSGFATNHQGLPWIPRTTLRGMLREACRTIIKERDSLGLAKDDLDEYFRQFFKYFEGDFLLISPMLPDAAIQPGSWPWLIHYFTEVDLDGCARDHSLRAWQCVARGTVFRGKIHGNAPDEAAITFLTDGLRRIRRLGGGRNRGLGKVKIEAVVHHPSSKVPELPPELEKATGPGALMLLVKLEDLTSIARSAGTGNLLLSRDYLRGENLLGALRHLARTQLLEQMVQAEITLLDDPGVDGPEAIFSPLYPVHADVTLAELKPQAVMPVPQTLKVPKYDPNPGSAPTDLPSWFTLHQGQSRNLIGQARDQLAKKHGEDESRHKDPGKKPKLKRLSGYLMATDTGWRHYHSPLSRSMRNAVNPDTGKVDDQKLFTEEALPDGTQLFGWIGFKSAESMRRLVNLFHRWFPLGEETEPLGVGRGRACMRIAACRWYGQAEIKIPPVSTDKDFTLTLVTDTVIWDGQCGTLPNLDADALRRAWSFWPQNVELHLEQAVEQVAVRTRMHGSGGFFTPPEYVLKGGSAYRFRIHGAAEDVARVWANLHRQSQQPLGEHTLLGYGQWALNLSLHNLTGSEPPSSEKQEQPVQIHDIRIPEGREHQLRATTPILDHLVKIPISRSKLQAFLHAVEPCHSADQLVALFQTLYKHAKRPAETFWNRSVAGMELPEFLRTHCSEDPRHLEWLLRAWLQKPEKEPNS